ncbi:hypothetical protein [Streptomyces sp. NPDC006971]|uniref:hypothetical protein n=1 Tax=Streptomyces sp. NPDC006971 TaxID=3154784 RepID=UPI0034111008
MGSPHQPARRPPDPGTAPDGQLAEIPWIHRDHAHHPFNDRTWRYVRTTVTRHLDPDRYEAGLADALDQLLRRARTGHATAQEQHLIARTAPCADAYARAADPRRPAAPGPGCR